ncbi:hypothetical protein MIND_00120700 [Mycena indigotica]|uniref:Uncharacterized protein n=1 Tax=Mycena indigotica TaxID=2126181 RepID=A0A8H6THW4_9AGAR|nr:uncharacterized protein MIND_00120700 [Mycena indigotica]KAF7316030.1 hypothetical protein MIND_00120700 [Mycena indigotica]
MARAKSRTTTPSPSSGLLALTDELLLEVVSHLERDPSPSSHYGVFFESRQQYGRTKALLALAQTCGRLRGLCLKLAVQHVRMDWSGRGIWSGRMALHPDIGPHVRTADFDLPCEPALPEFAACLASFPLLHTLTVSPIGSQGPLRCFRYPMSQPPHSLSDILHDHTFKSIQTLNLHFRAFSLVRCCPNVERLGLYGEWRENYATKLRAFRCNFFKNFPRSILVLQFFSVLEEIPDIDVQNVTPDLVQELEVMESLCRITFHQGPWMGQHQLGLGTLQLVQTAKDVLRRTAPGVSPKDKVVLVNVGDEGEEVPPLVFAVDAEEKARSVCSVDRCTVCAESEWHWDGL